MARRRKRNNDIAKQVFDLHPGTLRMIKQLAIMSKYSEQQVLEDLLHGGEQGARELYEEIKAWRTGGENKRERQKRENPVSEVVEEIEAENRVALSERPSELDNYPADGTGDFGAVERALASLGDTSERPGQLAESENGAEPPPGNDAADERHEMGLAHPLPASEPPEDEPNDYF